jgi:hypothetical protein
LIMKPILNKSMLRQATIDSGSLATMSSIIHKVAEQGVYRGILYRGEANVGKFSLKVSDNSKTLSEEGAPLQQVDIDLASLENLTGAKGKPVSFTLRTGGHVVFYVSTGSKEYAVELFRLEKQKEPIKVFDSRLLSGEDLFITHLMQPGSYTIQNVLGDGHADLTVEYPEHEKLTGNMDSVLVEYGDGTMNPAEVKIQPTQALMFSCVEESRITIELKVAEKAPVITLAAMRKKEGAGEAGRKKILRKIQFLG